MATIRYGEDKIKVVIGTMSWAEGLQLAKAFVGFVENSTDDATTILNTIGAYFAIYAPCKVYLDNQLIGDGEHVITVQDETVTVTLPLTVENFTMLPGPLVGDWIETATEQNQWLLNRLDFMVSRAISILSGPLPGSAPFSEPTKASEPMMTTG